jgi:Amt family ammonium transporter
VEWRKNGKPTLLGAMSGTVAGLGSITPAAGFVTPMASIIIGLVGGSLCYYTVTILKMKLRYDDTLDVFGIHGIAGTWGTLATGIFASVGAKGLLQGNPHQLWVQFIAVVATIVFTAVMTYLILKLVDVTIGLRVEAEGEFEGLDLSEHGESGYIL